MVRFKHTGGAKRRSQVGREDAVIKYGLTLLVVSVVGVSERREGKPEKHETAAHARTQAQASTHTPAPVSYTHLRAHETA